MHSKLKLTTALAGALLSAFHPAHAVEGGASRAGNGFDDMLMGYVIPDGNYVRLDALSYRANRLNDQNGNRATANLGPALAVQGVPLGTPGTSAPVNFKLDGTYTQLTLAKQTSLSLPLLNNDSLQFAVTIPYATQSVDVSTDLPVLAALGQPSRIDLGSGKVSSLGDVIVSPMMLGWRIAGTPWSFVASPFKVILKTGSYDTKRSSNYGRNYMTWGPNAAVTYFDEAGYEVSVQANYLANGRNKTTDYKSGNEFYTNFAVRRWLSDSFNVGVSGYYYKQVTDDKRAGVPVFSVMDPVADVLNNGVGNRGQAAALGPTVNWAPVKDVWVNLRWHREFAVKNKSQGDRLWVRASYAF
jgi:hypothetical protein